MKPGTISKTCAAIVTVFASTLILSAPNMTSAAVTYGTVALTGDPAPGTELGVRFASVGLPAINAAGQTAFRGELTGPGVDSTNSQGIWSEGSGILNLVAREGDFAQGTGPGVIFDSLFEPVINNAGQTAFFGGVQGQGVDETNNEGIWSNRSGTLELIVREGQQAPGTAPGVVLSRIPFVSGFTNVSPIRLPLFNGSGQTAFMGSLTGSGVTDENNVGIWSDGSGSLSLVAREGSQAPGAEPGVVFKNFGPDHPLLGDGGHTVFSGELAGPGVTNDNDNGIWSDTAGILGLLVREGDPVPGMNLGTQFLSLNRPVINGAGQVAFTGSVVESGSDGAVINGLWSQGSGSLSLVTQTGDVAPGTAQGVVFNSFSQVIVINGAGKIAFSGLVSGPDVNFTNWHGVWVEDDESLKLVVRLGDQAPGTPTGVVFGKDTGIVSFIAPLLNTAGQVAFKAPLVGAGIDDSNNDGIWATSPNGVLSLIAREGDLFDVNDDPMTDDFRTIDFLSIHTGSSDEDGRPTSLNDNGELAFFLHFTDGTSGIFVATIGLPGDLNGDGFVGVDDLNIVLPNWNQNVTPGDPLAGDANGDGFVGVDDLNIVLANWNTGTPPSGLTHIPEPASLTLFVGVLGALTSRRR